eukprot:1496200-Pyramimonas_sp.AAC.1
MIARSMPTAPRFPQMARPSPVTQPDSKSSRSRRQQAFRVASAREKRREICASLFSDLFSSQRPRQEEEEPAAADDGGGLLELDGACDDG